MVGDVKVVLAIDQVGNINVSLIIKTKVDAAPIR